MDKIADSNTMEFLAELFGTSTELRKCVESTKMVVETFLVSVLIVGIEFEPEEVERLQKALVLFNFLLED